MQRLGCRPPLSIAGSLHVTSQLAFRKLVCIVAASIKCGSYCTLVLFIGKNLSVSGPAEFKSVLLKGQLYSVYDQLLGDRNEGK